MSNFLEKIVSEVKNNSYTDIEKARYIYLEIGKLFKYNMYFYNILDRRFKEDIYTETIPIENIDDNKKISVVCKQMCEILSGTLNLVGLNSEIAGYNLVSMEHTDVILKINGKRYILDLSKDIYRIQKGFKTKGFAAAKTRKKQLPDEPEYDTMDEQKIAEIDNKLGYTYNGMYMEDAIEMLKKEFQDEEDFKKYIIENEDNVSESDLTKKEIIKYKFKYIFENIRNNISEKDKMGTNEIKHYFYKIIKELLSDEDLEFDFYDIRYNNFETSVIFHLKLEDEDIYYFYEDSDRKFEPKTKEQIIQMRENKEINTLDEGKWYIKGIDIER